MSKPPLVLHVIHHLFMGGMENGLINLINHMPPQRFRHAIACIEDYSDFRERIRTPGVEVFALYRSRTGVWRLRRNLFELCRQLRPAIVHSRNTSGLDALLPARLAGVRHCIHSEHGWDVDNLKGEKWKVNLNRRLHAPLVSRYITVSEDLKRHLVQRVGIDADRIVQIYNGVDTERFTPRGALNSELMPPGFRDDGSIVIGAVGRIQPVKDQATLMRAFAALRERVPGTWPRLRLAIAGNGPLLESLRALAVELGIAAQCWLPGAQEDVPAVLRGFDVFVLPSLNEGISNTILEAMASGLPVVATAVGGNVELVKVEETGCLFSPGDVDALASILQRYVCDTALRQAHGEAARRAAQAQFSLTAMVANYQGVYEQLIR